VILSHQRLTDIGVATQTSMQRRRATLLGADDDEIGRLARVGIFNPLQQFVADSGSLDFLSASNHVYPAGFRGRVIPVFQIVAVLTLTTLKIANPQEDRTAGSVVRGCESNVGLPSIDSRSVARRRGQFPQQALDALFTVGLPVCTVGFEQPFSDAQHVLSVIERIRVPAL
jgi:hypothetical protein